MHTSGNQGGMYGHLFIFKWSSVWDFFSFHWHLNNAREIYYVEIFIVSHAAENSLWEAELKCGSLPQNVGGLTSMPRWNEDDGGILLQIS